MVDLEGKKVGKTKATMTGLGAQYIAWKRKQKPKQKAHKLTSFVKNCRGSIPIKEKEVKQYTS